MSRLAAIRRILSWRQERVWSWLFLSCVLLLAAVIRFRLREMPLERDEGEYAYGGQLLLQGIWPGHSLYTMKIPGTHAAYALLMSVSGQSSSGVHLGLLVINCATIALLFLLSRALADAVAGCVAAAAYALMSLSPDTLGTAGHATHFVVLCAVAGLLALWKASETKRPVAYLVSGIFFGAGVLMKQNGIFFAALGTAWMLWLGHSPKTVPKLPFLKVALVFLLGMATPFLLLLLVLWRAGTFEKCLFWWVTYARAYSKPFPGMTLAWDIMLQRMPPILQWPFYLALLGLAALWSKRSSWSVAAFGTGFLFLSLIAIFPGLHFRPHYFVLLMPALAFLIGILVQKATDVLRGSRFGFSAPFALCVIVFCAGIAQERKLFFQSTPIEACRLLYGFEPFPEALVLGDHIRMHSAPDTRIAVLGSEPEVYFYSRRRSATGFIYTYPLTEPQPFAPKMRQQMKEEIRAAQPQFLVQIRSWTSWVTRPGSEKRISELCDVLTPPGYKLIGLCEFFPNESRVAWHWRPEPLEQLVSPASELLLFENGD